MTQQRDYQNLRERTDAKLRYARVQIAHLRDHGGNGGTDFDRAFHESILFHLFGAREAFLHELNAYYGAGLSPEGVTLGRLQKAIRGQGRRSAEAHELHALEQDASSWLSDAKAMRDHATHRHGVPRAHYVGGPRDSKVYLKNPVTLRETDEHAEELLEHWVANMTGLLDRLRASAMTANP